LRPHQSVEIRAEARRLGKLRLIEIAVAVLLTLAALLFVGLTVWTADELKIHEHYTKTKLD
jgi:hypothetical protein